MNTKTNAKSRIKMGSNATAVTASTTNTIRGKNQKLSCNVTEIETIALTATTMHNNGSSNTNEQPENPLLTKAKINTSDLPEAVKWVGAFRNTKFT